ncbi:hypothetical protein BD311DRAFT_766420 [Dichomitus squalens]|uniref:Uncharacterized protein n=1 Tax=Dichomitus squalens TaxID=114155 RepID=A0A4V2JZG6_9APHY|nr:hypothetical protein BD311DRAFT_766420 [Dichomitus squalens]
MSSQEALLVGSLIGEVVWLSSTDLYVGCDLPLLDHPVTIFPPPLSFRGLVKPRAPLASTLMTARTSLHRVCLTTLQ